MTLRQYTIILSIGTIIIWFTWFLVLSIIDPVTTGLLGFTIFYITLFGGLVGLLTILSIIIRSFNHHTRDIEDVVVVSLRQSIFLALLLICALIIASQQLLNWLSLIGALIIVSLLETVFILRKKPVKHHENS